MSTENEKHKVDYKKIFDNIDKGIIACNFDFRELTGVYDGLFNYLKEKAGTSAGFTGLAEYIILNTIFLYLKQKLNIQFKPEAKTKDVNFFISTDKRILITHSISINEEMGKVVVKKFGKNIIWSFSKKSPDIVIFNSTDSGYSPEAIIQIKLYAVSSGIIDGEVNKIKKMLSGVKNNKPFCCIIFFHKLSPKIENKLKKDFNFVITPDNPNFIEMLQKIEMRLH
ncbi:MAG: hypothetical protein QXZ59_00660 [Nitrososphaeria archaeon]